MEADWEVEIAPDAPVIDASWAGYVDLLHAPERILEIQETAGCPALAETLIRLNLPVSPMRTIKCDLWQPDTVDPYEVNAEPEHAVVALACYIDLLPVGSPGSTLDETVDWCRRLCLHLRPRPLRQCRVDLIVRYAFLTPNAEGLGVTAYLVACGSSRQEAAEVLSRALSELGDAILAAG